MTIEIGKTYFCPHALGPRSVHVIGPCDTDAFKVKYSEDDWGCRSMTGKEIEERFYLKDYQEAVEASRLVKSA